MATIGYNFNVVNGSGSYTIQVKNCSGTSTMYAHTIAGQTSNGTVNGTLSDVSLNRDLGSVKLYIYDTINNGVVNESACFNHNCASCVSITDFTLSTSTNLLNYAEDMTCTISGVNGDAPHSYSFKLKQNGSIIATNTDNSSNTFTFTNNLCGNAGTVTVEASVTNCGGTITKTNTLTINVASPPAPILGICYLGSATWKLMASVANFPESLFPVYYEDGTFVGYMNKISSNSAEIVLESPVINGQYYVKNILCGLSSSNSNSVTISLAMPVC